MKKLSLVLTFICFALVQFSFACNCDDQEEFLKAAPQTEFVALVKVTKHLTFKNIYGVETPISMEVEVLDIYKGKERRKKITIWGGDVNINRPFLLKFEVGNYFVLALDKVVEGSKEIAHQDEKKSDYIITNCGERWLRADVNQATATNWITEDIKEYKLSEIKASLLKE